MPDLFISFDRVEFLQTSGNYIHTIGTGWKICNFLYIIKCQSISYKFVKFQVEPLGNKKVTCTILLACMITQRRQST